MAEDVSLEEIADGSENFSGADLQAVITTAQLASLEHLLHVEEKVFVLNIYYFKFASGHFIKYKFVPFN